MSYNLPSRRLVSQDDAAMIQRPDVPRSKFIGSWGRKTAFNAGSLVPILVEEVLPGDHLTYDVTAHVRMATPLFPMFDSQRIDTHFFFVPNRLVWNNWAKFMGEQEDPSSSIDYTLPQMESPSGGYDVGSLHDHMGLPTTGQIVAPETIVHHSLPLRAYNLIYNEWFRDENVMDSLVVDKDDGPDAPGDYVLQRRSKSHDYFTSALPWAQKFTAPNVPLAGSAPIIGLGILGGSSASGAGPFIETGGSSVAYPFYTRSTGGAAGETLYTKYNTTTQGPDIYANLADATGVAINQFRQAFLIQQLLERDARGGTRYTEKIRSHFGVTNPDFRLQRPEYIGGGQSPMNLTPIAQTAPTAEEPLGALGAAGTASGTHRASYAATEHGYIIGLISVRTELSYQQGIPRHWSRQTQYDFYFPSTAGLGEQAILRQEIYATGSPSNDQAVFGYQERWQEYRTRYSEVTGIMRSTAAGTIDAWHLAQNFVAAPTLSATFLYENPPMTRVLAAGSLANGQQYLADIFYRRTAVRPIPTFGTPVTLGRF